MYSHQQYIQYILDDIILNEEKERYNIYIMYCDDNISFLQKKYYLFSLPSIQSHICGKYINTSILPKNFSSISIDSAISTVSSIQTIIENDNYVYI